MLARTSGLVKVVPRLSRGLPLIRCMGGGTPAHWKSEVEIDTTNKTTIDFLPVPQLYKFDCFYLHGQPNYKNIKIEEY